MRTAAALIIGNEILSGKTADENGPALARELRALGVDLRRMLVVPDEMDEIVDATRALAAAHDWVFTSGGVGPTHDDITIEAVARALGKRLVRDPELERLLRGHYDSERHPQALRMAEVPEGSTLVYGEGVRIPAICVDNVFVLPGVPSLFRKKLAALRDLLRDAPFHLRTVFVSENEVQIAGTLYGLVARHPALLLGSYPELANPEYQVKLTLESKDRELVERALAELLAALPAGAVLRVA